MEKGNCHILWEKDCRLIDKAKPADEGAGQAPMGLGKGGHPILEDLYNTFSFGGARFRKREKEDETRASHLVWVVFSLKREGLAEKLKESRVACGGEPVPDLFRIGGGNRPSGGVKLRKGMIAWGKGKESTTLCRGRYTKRGALWSRGLQGCEGGKNTQR